MSSVVVADIFRNRSNRSVFRLTKVGISKHCKRCDFMATRYSFAALKVTVKLGEGLVILSVKVRLKIRNCSIRFNMFSFWNIQSAFLNYRID